jgi:hypothetical protein
MILTKIAYTSCMIILMCVILSMLMCMYNKTITFGPEYFTNSNKATLRFIADDILYIFLDKGSKGGLGWSEKLKYIVTVRCCNRVVTYNIPNFEDGDRLVFFLKNTGGPGYMAGDILWKGVEYPTNNTNFKCIGTTGFESRGGLRKAIIRPTGKRIGCYTDSGSRALPAYLGNKKTNKECKQLAKSHNHRYYGLQYGGECWAGSDLTRATKYGKKPDGECLMRGKKNTTTNLTQRQGGGWRNDIYDNHSAPNIRECGNVITKNPGLRNKIHAEAKMIKAEEGPHCIHSDYNDWIEFEWKPEPLYSPEPDAPPPPIKYCPDIRYTEFNSSACKDSSTVESCMNSSDQGYVADKTLCRNKFNISDMTSSQTEVYSILYDVLENTKNTNSTEALTGTKGSGYRGYQNVTKSGHTCQRWDSQSPHPHSNTPDKKPTSGLEQNYCRNPDGSSTIWCYTTNKHKRFEMCSPKLTELTSENKKTIQVDKIYQQLKELLKFAYGVKFKDSPKQLHSYMEQINTAPVIRLLEDLNIVTELIQVSKSTTDKNYMKETLNDILNDARKVQTVKNSYYKGVSIYNDKKKVCCDKVPYGKCVRGCPVVNIGGNSKNACEENDPNWIPYNIFEKNNCSVQIAPA